MSVASSTAVQAPGLSAAQRLAWPDAARGITVLLVVAMHVHYLHLARMVPGAPAGQVHEALIDLVTPMRMPLFFVLSGYLSAGMLRRSWRAGLSGRVAPQAYLYAVWLGITALVLQADAAAEGAPFRFWDYTLPQLFEPWTALWYLWALAVYFAVARATRALPAWPAVALAGALSIVGDGLEGPMHPIVVSFVWFLAGVRLPELVRALTGQRGRWMPAAALLLAAALLALHLSAPTVALLERAASIASVALALLVVPRFAHWAVLRPIRHVGRNTLAIFAMHPLLLIAGNAVLRQWDGLRSLLETSLWWSLLLPAVEVALIAAIALLLQRGLRAVGLSALFALPRGRALRERLRRRLLERLPHSQGRP